MVLPTGSTAPELVSLLRPMGGVTVLRLQHARGLMCGLAGVAETRAFNELATPLLRVPAWCTRCRGSCADLLPRWLAPAEIGSVRE